MLTALQWLLVALGSLMAVGTLLSFSHSPHWGVRNWDFPRVQIAVAAAGSGAGYAALFFRGRTWEWPFLAVTAATVAWQGYKIWPYTPLGRKEVERSRRVREDARRDEARQWFSLLVSNVLMENGEHDRFLRVVRDCDADLVLALEVDAAWMRAMEPLARDYPYVVRQPQQNYYGMVLFSRLELVDPEVRFLVQDDIPSIHTGVRLPGGGVVTLHGLHPRPPEPIRDQPSTPRDAELILMGRHIGDEEDRATVVAGDLNDVAWSPTSELFLRLSGLLDPRKGRGMFNSYNAKNPLFRFPLDHVFHSNDFRLVSLRRLEKVGSDHFPIYIRLSWEPDAEAEQPEPEEAPGDEEEAQERLEEQAEAARTGDDRPSRE